MGGKDVSRDRKVDEFEICFEVAFWCLQVLLLYWLWEMKNKDRRVIKDNFQVFGMIILVVVEIFIYLQMMGKKILLERIQFQIC